MRILFMGTPDIAATCLDTLVRAGCDVVGAVTGEDKPRGRGYVMTPPPVKVTAEKYEIPVYQPKTLRDGEFFKTLTEIAPDIIIVVAYGKILPSDIINYPRYGCVNLHVSLLPKYRGAAPMQRAIMNGDRETGVTLMRMDEGLDTGDIIACERFAISDTDNFEDIHDRSAEIGAALLVKTLPTIEDGTAVYTPQADDFTYAAKIEKADRVIDFSKTTREIDCQIRGLSPIPLAYTVLPDGRMLKVVSAAPAKGHGNVGEVIELDDKSGGKGIVVATADSAISLLCVVPEGKGKMSAQDFIRGRKISKGDIFKCSM